MMSKPLNPRIEGVRCMAEMLISSERARLAAGLSASTLKQKVANVRRCLSALQPQPLEVAA